MIDLTQAQAIILEQKRNNTYRGAKIGVVRQDVHGCCITHQTGQVILFREWEDDPAMITIELPLSAERLAYHQSIRSLITTDGTIVGVPRSRVDEIKLDQIQMELSGDNS